MPRYDTSGPLQGAYRSSGWLNPSRHRWALVLAGGDGQRLAGWARRLYGYERAKQFCSFDGGCTLLEQTLQRAARVVDRDRIVVMITRHQWTEARECLAMWPDVWVIDQPANRDTLPGILWPSLRIHDADPEATLAVLPSDHHIGPPGSGDRAFVRSVLGALDLAVDCPGTLTLLGAQPQEELEGLGWIVPTSQADEAAVSVRAFREKPSMAEASALHQGGALVNTFVMAARASTLSEIARRHCPEWWSALAGCLDGSRDLDATYRTLPNASFSKDVLAVALDRLRVVQMRGVNWADVGTPERMAASISDRPDSTWLPPMASAVAGF